MVDPYFKAGTDGSKANLFSFGFNKYKTLAC